MPPKRQEVEGFLDLLEFGPYQTPANDCDVMASKARRAIEISHPAWQTGIRIMYGVYWLGFRIIGHGILAVKCSERDLYYDCTTASGKDSSRFRAIGWPRCWTHYLGSGVLLFWWYTEWGQYTPSRIFRRLRRLHPRLLEVRLVCRNGNGN